MEDGERKARPWGGKRSSLMTTHDPVVTSELKHGNLALRESAGRQLVVGIVQCVYAHKNVLSQEPIDPKAAVNMALALRRLMKTFSALSLSDLEV